jgi:hypothetical protein
MNEQQALRVSASDPASNPGLSTANRSGVFAKGRRDAGGGWGLVLVDLEAPTRVVSLSDGAVVGAGARDAKIEGPGVAPEHARVSVRSDGCYLEDLGTSDGTFVDGVRARRIGVMHGNVVRLGRQLAVFVERDLAIYQGEAMRSGALVHGPKQRRDWIDPVLELVKNGSCVCIEGTPGVGKRSLAKLAAALREAAGEIVTVDARGDAKAQIPAGARPTTWVVLDADRLPRAQQLEIAHAVGRATGVTIIATTSQPLDRAAGDGHIAPWFASLFSGKRITVPSLEHRREDIPAIVRELCQKRSIALSRVTPEFLEAIVRAGWPGGVPQLEQCLLAASEASQGGELSPASVASSLSRAMRPKPSLPPATDPSLARARLEDALARANGSVASAARALGMSRQAIYREADRLGLDIARRKTRG